MRPLIIREIGEIRGSFSVVLSIDWSDLNK